MGRVADLNLRGNTTEPCLISIDKNTNELVAVRQEHVYIPNEIKGVTLTPDEIQKLKNGEQIFCGRHEVQPGKGIQRNLAVQCGKKGYRVHIPKGPGIQPTVSRRCTAFTDAAQGTERRPYHSCGGHEAKER